MPYKHYPYILTVFATSGTVVIMIALAFAYVPYSGVISLQRMASAKPRVVALASNAFGSLSGSTAEVSNTAGGTVQSARDNGSAALSATEVAPTPPVPQGAGGTVSTMSATAGNVKMAPSAIARPIMPPYQPTAYRYVYGGDPIQAPAEQMDVYRHTVMSSLSDAPASVLQSAGLGSINVGSFSSVKMQNVTFVEDRDNGYVISTDFQNGMVSINENWERKTNNPYKCVNGICPTVEPLRADQVPSDEELIRMSDGFLAAHGVDASLYGTPVVDHSWRVYAMMDGGALKTTDAVPAAKPTALNAASADQADAPSPAVGVAPSTMPIRAPDQISITYPYLVDGQEVRSSSGDPIGMNVSVNLRDRSIAGIWGIALQSYEKSSYATEQDTARIMSFVERGGLYGSTYTDPNAKTVDVELGKPSIELASFGHQTADGRWEDLYVPSLVFPVVKKPADAPWLQNNVVVPLIKDLLVEPEQPTPIMYMKSGGGTSGSSGSAEGVVTPPTVTPEVQSAPAPAKR